MLSFKQVESNNNKKEPWEQGCSFLIVWISYTVNMILLFVQFELKMTVDAAILNKKKSVKWRTYDTFLRRVNFILMFLQKELTSLLNMGKPFSSDLEG